MKNFFAAIPADVKQTLTSLAVAVALLCGSLFVLSAYADTVRSESPVPDAMAEVSSTESDGAP